MYLSERSSPNLRVLNLKVTYRSFDEDLVNDFYVPCLKNSILYKRAVGYFSSAALSEAARGLFGLVNNDGKMVLVASPRLSEQDIEAIKNGYELRDRVIPALEKGLDLPLEREDEEKIRNLTWMIANDKLDIKIAIPSKNSSGIYHEKIGLFYDTEGNVVSFSGSLNETGSALISNYESIDVSVSWEDGIRERERVNEHISHFEGLWSGSIKGLLTIDFPSALKQKLLEKYTPKKPIEKKVILPEKAITELSPCGRSLYDFQQAAINAWFNASCKGVLAMATGSGKTFTAIKALEQCSGLKVALVIVPSSNLVFQWEDEIRKEYGDKCIIRRVQKLEHDWKGKIERLFDWLAVHDLQGKRAFVIATVQSGCKSEFLNLINKVNETSIGIIVDEVHRSGAPRFRAIFNIQARYRIALSATPEREWDEEGNQAIFDYFGRVVFEYSLDDAIRDGKLSQYYYYSHIVPLTFEERLDFNNISKQIATLTSKINKEYPNTYNMSMPKLVQYLDMVSKDTANNLRRLFLKRVDIVKEACNKYECLRNILRNYPLKRCIVYCNDLVHLRQNTKIIYDEGFEPIEFSSDVLPTVRREILDTFESETNKNSILVAVKCLDEGIDIPACDSAILVSSSRSTREFIQRRGRLLRKHESKKYSTIHDIVILPFATEEESYPLTMSEFSFVKEELRRVDLLSKNAINSKDFNVDNQLQIYRRHLLG